MQVETSSDDEDGGPWLVKPKVGDGPCCPPGVGAAGAGGAEPPVADVAAAPGVPAVDAGAAPKAAAKAAVKAAAKAAGGAQGLESVSIHHNGQYIGSIKIDRRRKQFNAHCCMLGNGALKDHRTATMAECRMNRRFASKPLGFLVQWLRQGFAYDSREDHRDSASIISMIERRECREWLQQEAEVDDKMLMMLKLEAEWLDLHWTGVATVVE